MATIKFIQAQAFSISSAGASAGDTTLILQSFKQIDGTTNIVTADLGDQCYGTLEPNNGTQEEAIQFTGVTQNANGTATLTGVSSVGFVSPYTITSGLSKSHAGGVTFILSNDAAFYGNIRSYINTTAASGAALSDYNTAGLVQQATTAQINSSLATGTTGAHLFVSPDQLAASTYALASGTVLALAGTSGTPSATNLFVTQASLKFGGTGSDGALSSSSGATNIDLGSAQIVIKNYTSISLTGTASLTFTNPHANGTIIVLKSQGNVTLTSSAAPIIAANSLGAAAATNGWGFFSATNKGATGGAAGVFSFAPISKTPRNLQLFTGAGGGSAASGGAGGLGGGGLYIECGGALNFTTASGISVGGVAGSNSGSIANGGGGGGAGGSCIILYNTLTASSGTITIAGGKGGDGAGSFKGLGGNGGNSLTGGSGNGGASNNSVGGSAGGGASGFTLANGSAGADQSGGSSSGGGGGGASGLSLVAANTEFV